MNLLRESRDLTTMTMIKVRRAEPIGDYRLKVEFSDDTVGERDFSFITGEAGPLLEPLKDPAYFRRVFVESGALTWPNGTIGIQSRCTTRCNRQDSCNRSATRWNSSLLVYTSTFSAAMKASCGISTLPN